MFNKLRKFFRRNSESLDFIYLHCTAQYNTAEDTINALTRIKYRYDNKELEKLDAKLITFFTEIEEYPKDKNLVEVRRKLTEDLIEPDTSVKDFLIVLIEHKEVSEIINILKHLNILMIPQIIRFIIIHSVTKYKNDEHCQFMRNRSDIVKSFFKIFFKFIFDTNFKDQQYFFNTIKECLSIALSNNSIDIINYLLTILDFNWGVKSDEIHQDFEILQIEKIGEKIHITENCEWFKLSVTWKSQKLNNTPDYFIYEYFNDKKRKIIRPRKAQHFDDTAFPIYQNVKWYKNRQIPVFTQNSKN